MLTPNEWGDFLAGSFGPLALAWLVFAFFQQGKELSASVKALELQSEELRASVQQQTTQAEVATEALKLDLEKAIEMTRKEAQNYYSDIQVSMDYLSETLTHLKSEFSAAYAVTGMYESGAQAKQEDEITEFQEAIEKFREEIASMPNDLENLEKLKPLVERVSTLYGIRNALALMDRSVELRREKLQRIQSRTHL